MMRRFIMAIRKRNSLSDIFLLEQYYIQSVNVIFLLPSALADGNEGQKEDGFSRKGCLGQATFSLGLKPS